MGYVDLHCHLLWALDDGCRSPDETLQAARALVACGYTDVAASPHVQLRYAGGDARQAEARLGEARALLAEAGVSLTLHAGGENMLDEAFLARVVAGEPRGMGETGRFVLLEVPFLDPVPALPSVVAHLRARGVRPLLAHPERCAEFERPGRAAEVVRLGAALQMNLGSLTGRHGRPARKLAERILDEGLYAVAGTDLHAPQAADEWITDAHEVLATRAGGAALRRLCSDNPRRVLLGEELL
jgi:protein-tyrosine phosphatase